MQWIGYTPLVLLVYIYLLQGQAYPGGALESIKLVKWISYIVITMTIPIYILSLPMKLKLRDPGIVKYILLLIALMCYSTFHYSLSMSSLLESIVVYLRYPILFIVIDNFIKTNKSIKLYIYSIFFMITFAFFLTSGCISAK